jgi:putative hydrolase of the HAD superfamily
LTNNVGSDDRDDVAPVMQRFHHVFESSKLGSRKPEPVFYQRACRLAGVNPKRVVFLDDLGVNLKPAREMGMTTIKVVDPERAIDELEQILGISLR